MGNGKTEICLLCEECPYTAEDIEDRKQFFGEDFQPECCWCDKVGGKIAYFGYCDEAFLITREKAHHKPHRYSGYAYRQRMKRKKLRDHIKLFAYGYRKSLGTYENGHIKYSRNSTCQKFCRNQTSRKIRQFKGEIPNGGAYRRFYDYWWNID